MSQPGYRVPRSRPPASSAPLPQARSTMFGRYWQSGMESTFAQSGGVTIASLALVRRVGGGVEKFLEDVVCDGGFVHRKSWLSEWFNTDVVGLGGFYLSIVNYIVSDMSDRY